MAGTESIPPVALADLQSEHGPAIPVAHRQPERVTKHEPKQHSVGQPVSFGQPVADQPSDDLPVAKRCPVESRVTRTFGTCRAWAAVSDASRARAAAIGAGDDAFASTIVPGTRTGLTLAIRQLLGNAGLRQDVGPAKGPRPGASRITPSDRNG